MKFHQNTCWSLEEILQEFSFYISKPSDTVNKLNNRILTNLREVNVRTLSKVHYVGS